MWLNLTRDVLETFIEAAGGRQRGRLDAWEATHRRRRQTRGETMVLTIAKKAQALGAVATALEGLTPEDGLEVLGMLPGLTAAKLGALCSLAKDLADVPPDDLASVLAMAEDSITDALPDRPARTPRAPRREGAAKPGRPEGEKTRERLAYVEREGAVMLDAFAAHFGAEKDAACHWLKKQVQRGKLAKGRTSEYLSLDEAARRRMGAA